jgi:hypothetical protein
MELLGTSTFEEGERRWCTKDEHKRKEERECTVRLFGTNSLKEGAV